eukprot:m.192112 g.192112  ORF g.192112 m.192112 type:complete len:493 (+) comp18564_c0_seq1:78-1556(+)
MANHRQPQRRYEATDAAWPTQQYYGLSDELLADGSPYGVVRTQVYQDMTQPLPSYFISAGHNSYLEGNQVTGKSGLGTIKRSLLLGCRVLELDCWDPNSGCYTCCSRHSDVVCTHGGTLTSRVTFTTCCEAIRDHAFVASSYPVIISLELHVSNTWAEHMARVIREVFGDSLYLMPLGTHDFPSPEALQGKILIRTALEDAPALETLVGIHKMGRKSMEDAMQTSPAKVASMPAMSVSFKESHVDERLASDPRDAASTVALNERLMLFRRMASRHLVRVYPNGQRLTSSNYCPWAMWFAGASMATLNWQVWDRDVMTNLAFFRDNGACGYKLKPAWARGEAGAAITWAVAVARPIGYRSGESKRRGKVELKMCVHGTEDNVRNPAVESKPWSIATMTLKNGKTKPILMAAHRVTVAVEVAVLTIWVEHRSCDGMVCVPLHTLRPGRWWFPVLNRNGHVHPLQTHNDWLAMDVHLEKLAHGAPPVGDPDVLRV